MYKQSNDQVKMSILMSYKYKAFLFICQMSHLDNANPTGHLER